MSTVLLALNLSFYNLIAQNNISRFSETLSNDNLVFEVSKVGDSHLADSGRFYVQKILITVTSLNVDSLLKRVDKKELIGKLIGLLDDENKDWYSNAILYCITDREAIPFIVLTNRADWVKYQKQKDLVYWHNYLKEDHGK